jgi:RNA polymerase sigma-70 factor, ECF subfamily
MADSNQRERLRIEVERLYAEHGPALLAYAISLVGDRATAEDALHQVFLKLMAGKIPWPAEPKPYLFRAVRNTVLNARRVTSRQTDIESAALFVSPSGLDEAGRELERALAEIPDDQRQIVVLKIWGGFTLEEAAELAGISPNTAASRYRYALTKLRQRMSAFVKEES